MAKTTEEIKDNGSKSEKLNYLIELTWNENQSLRNINQSLKRYGVD